MSVTREHFRRLVFFGAFVALVLNVLKGARIPGRWVTTHLQVDYHFGFLKRALPGALFKALGLPVETFFGASMICIGYTVLCAAALAGVVWASGLTRSIQGRVLFFVACASYAVVLLTHYVGYYEQLLFLGLALSLLALIRMKGLLQEVAALGFCMGVCVACILVHELYVMLAAPLICLGFMLKGRLGMGVIFGAFSLAMALWMVEQGISPEVSERALSDYYQERANFPLRYDVFYIYWRDVKENIKITKEILGRPHIFVLYVGSFLVLTPVSMVFLGASLYRLRPWVRGKVWWQRVLVVMACVLGSTGMQLMTFFGWDYERWHTHCVVTSFLCVCLVWSQTEEVALPPRVQHVMSYVLACVVMVNLMTGFRLFDEYDPTPAPYVKHIRTLDAYLEGHAPIFLPPLY